jgi:hypothetical protein
VGGTPSDVWRTFALQSRPKFGRDSLVCAMFARRIGDEGILLLPGVLPLTPSLTLFPTQSPTPTPTLTPTQHQPQHQP